MTKASPGAIAYIERLVAYYHDPANGPDFADAPKPPSDLIGHEVAAATARMMAIFIDYQMTGELHEEPCPEATLQAAERVQQALDAKEGPRSG